MIIAFAGRRIDEKGSKNKRFPRSKISAVKQELYRYLKDKPISALISSAACGGDLLALETAQSLDIPTLVILPFEVSAFKVHSVLDCPGSWKDTFDGVIKNLNKEQLIMLGIDLSDETAYEKVNEEIFRQAELAALKLKQSVEVLIAWDGKPKTSDDLTYQFLQIAQQKQLSIHIIKTNK